MLAPLPAAQKLEVAGSTGASWLAVLLGCSCSQLPPVPPHLCLDPAHSPRAPGGEIELWGNLVGLSRALGSLPVVAQLFPVPS